MVAYNQNLGMNPVKSFHSYAYSPNYTWYAIASGTATNIFVGTPVIITAGFATVANSAGEVLGSARAFKDFTTGGAGIVAPSANQGVVPSTIQQYWAANTVKPTGVQTYVAVQIGTDILYDMQADVTQSPNGFAQNQLTTRLNFSTSPGFTSGDGNTSTGFSTTKIGAAGSCMSMVNLSPNIGNAWSQASNNALFTPYAYPLYS
jgi:hypothetical protein